MRRARPRLGRGICTRTVCVRDDWLCNTDRAVRDLGEFSRAGCDPQGASMVSDQARNSAPARTPADGALVGARSGPTALRIALGTQLRRLREASHITTEDAAEAIRATHSKISRLERGRSGANQRDVAALLTL